jgi:hypothetical protein
MDEAERLKLKVPLEENKMKTPMEKLLGEEKMEKLEKWNPLEIHGSTIEKSKNYFMATFRKDLIHKYAKKKEDLFSASDYRYVTQHLCFEAGEGLRHMIYEGKQNKLDSFV